MLVLGLNVTGRRWNFKGGVYWGCVLKRDGETLVADSPPSLSPCPPPHLLCFPSSPSPLVFHILAMRLPFLPSHEALQAQRKGISWSQTQTSKTENQNRRFLVLSRLARLLVPSRLARLLVPVTDHWQRSWHPDSQARSSLCLGYERKLKPLV